MLSHRTCWVMLTSLVKSSAFCARYIIPSWFRHMRVCTSRVCGYDTFPHTRLSSFHGWVRPQPFRFPPFFLHTGERSAPRDGPLLPHYSPFCSLRTQHFLGHPRSLAMGSVS